MSAAITSKIISGETPGFAFTLIIPLLMFNLVNGLRLTNMSAPVVADTNQNMVLDCHFDMESEELYAVKWYKDDQEFFRYMPHQQPHNKDFPVSGVHLASDGINCGGSHCRIQLTKLTRHHSDGAYRCEVSSEAPTFRLAAETHNITVATLPKRKPTVEGLEKSYNEGDILSANCTASPSDPAANITWFINNQQNKFIYVLKQYAPGVRGIYYRLLLLYGHCVYEILIGVSTQKQELWQDFDNPYLKAAAKFIEEMRTSDTDGSVLQSVSLRFQVNRKYTQGNGDAMDLRCVSTLPGIPLPSQEVSHSISLKINKPQVVSNQKLHWLHSSSATSTQHHYLIILLLMTTVRWLLRPIELFLN